MSIFNKSKNASSSAAAPQVVSCCLCGSQVADDDEHRTKLKNSEFVCMDCLRSYGLPGMPDYQYNSDVLRRVIKERSTMVGSYHSTDLVVKDRFEVDRNHEAFWLGGNVFRYDQLLSFHLTNEVWPLVWDWGKDVVTNLTCSCMCLRITFRNAHMDHYTLWFINSPVYATTTAPATHQPALTSDYINALTSAWICMTYLEQIQDTVRAHEREELLAAIAGAAAPSAADEIRKFHQLAEDGIISQEEFESKKQQLLEG